MIKRTFTENVHEVVNFFESFFITKKSKTII